MEAFLTLSTQADVVVPSLVKKRKWTQVGDLLSGKFDELAYAALVTWRYGLPDLTSRIRSAEAAGRDAVSLLLENGCTPAQARGVMFTMPNQHLRCLYYFTALCDERHEERVLALVPDDDYFSKLKTRARREAATPARLDAALIATLFAGRRERLEGAVAAATDLPLCALLAETFGAYHQVLEAIRERDASALRLGVSRCDDAFAARRRPDQFGFGGNMHGGETANDDVLDFRLASILTVYESWGPVAKLATIHKLPN